jgi:hypothetical protein
MDPDIVDGIVAVLGLMVPLLGLSIVGVVVLGRSRLGEARARRVAGDRYDPETDQQIAALQDEVAILRHRLQETQERVEFTERLLSRPTVPSSSPADPPHAPH